MGKKIAHKIVGEIDIRCQFHLHFMHAFFCTKVFFSSYALAKKALLYKKRPHKMLMKLTPGLVVGLRSKTLTSLAS